MIALVFSAGCAYRINVQQGNLVDQSALEQVQQGMTRSQVQFLLGTPMIADPFHAARWDYPYYFQRGRKRQMTRRWFSVHFEDERVARIEHHIGAPGQMAVPVDPDAAAELEAAADRDLRDRDSRDRPDPEFAARD